MRLSISNRTDSDRTETISCGFEFLCVLSLLKENILSNKRYPLGHFRFPCSSCGLIGTLNINKSVGAPRSVSKFAATD